ncbi:MAG: adenosylcobinamide-GDP ribazoletransferase [Prochlorococcaceae cyanobacterium]
MALPGETPPGPALRAPLWWRDLAGAWVFYSVLPAWPWVRPRFERIARFAPWLGLVLGGILALAWLLGAGRLPRPALVALVLALGLLLSGGLHMDGAMDTADGLAAGERYLEAMADSRVGASGAQALALLLLLRGAALVILAAAVPPLAVALALVWTAFWARVAPLLAVAWFPYLREREAGATAGFHRRHWRGLGHEAAPALLAAAALVVGSLLLQWPLNGLLAAVPALLVPLWLGRRLGGHSGDSYGACVEWSEALGLLLIALFS